MTKKYSSQQRLANLLRTAVERETPDAKDKVMASAYNHERRSDTEPLKSRRHPAMRYAVTFLLAVLIMSGALVIPKTISPAPEPAVKNNTSATAPKSSPDNMAQQNPFILEAYAAENNAASSSNNPSSQSAAKFGLSLTRKISVSGIDCSKAQADFSIYNTSGILKEDDTSTIYAKYLGFNLKCVGKHIKSVTYSTDRGGFAQVKSLPVKQFLAIQNSIPYNVEQFTEDFKKYGKEWQKKDPEHKILIPTPNPNYGDGKSMEVDQCGWGVDDHHMEYDGFLPVGKSYTISYADQDDYTKQYVLRITKSISKADEKKWDAAGDMKSWNHTLLKAMEGTGVTITATYEDGSTCSRQCTMTLDTKTWELHAVEK